jgi:hypothetical protein
MGDKEVSAGSIGGDWFRDQSCGKRQLFRILPYSHLQDDEEVSEFALDGLKQVMAIKSRVVLPYLVPKVNPNTWQTPTGIQNPHHSFWACCKTSSEHRCWGRAAGGCSASGMLPLVLCDLLGAALSSEQGARVPLLTLPFPAPCLAPNKCSLHQVDVVHHSTS